MCRRRKIVSILKKESNSVNGLCVFSFEKIVKNFTGNAFVLAHNSDSNTEFSFEQIEQMKAYIQLEETKLLQMVDQKSGEPFTATFEEAPTVNIDDDGFIYLDTTGYKKMIKNSGLQGDSLLIVASGSGLGAVINGYATINEQIVKYGFFGMDRYRGYPHFGPSSMNPNATAYIGSTVIVLTMRMTDAFRGTRKVIYYENADFSKTTDTRINGFSGYRRNSANMRIYELISYRKSNSNNLEANRQKHYQQ